MNHCVPEFEMDEDYPTSSSADMPRQKNMQQDEIMELLWQNGQVVVQTQNPRLPRKYSPPPAKSTHYDHNQQEYHQPPSRPAPPPPSNSDSAAHLFMQEDEMISWLQYPLEDPGFDRDLTDLLYHPPGPPPSTSAVTAALRLPASPPPPPPPTQQRIPAHAANFPQFTRTATKIPDSRPSASSRYDGPRESTVVDSSDTPAVRQNSKFPPTRTAIEVSGAGSFSGGGAIAGTSTAGGSNWCKSMSRDGETCELTRDGETCELTLASSPSGASASATATADRTTQSPADDRKRKGREPANDATTEFQSEDAEIESFDTKKQARGAAGKRSRAAEVHNLSERRRRDRINEKMKALQELIPRCTKTDKASMLDEAIEYLKSLQLQIQMMSMGCGMVPVMFPGLQQYLPSMGMGMSRPMIPFPGVLPGSGLPTPGNPRFPLPAFPMPPISSHDASITQQVGNQTGVQSNMPMRPNMAGPYQQGIGIQQMPVQTTQSHLTPPSDTSKASSSRGAEDNENP